MVPYMVPCVVPHMVGELNSQGYLDKQLSVLHRLLAHRVSLADSSWSEMLAPGSDEDAVFSAGNGHVPLRLRSSRVTGALTLEEILAMRRAGEQHTGCHQNPAMLHVEMELDPSAAANFVPVDCCIVL